LLAIVKKTFKIRRNGALPPALRCPRRRSSLVDRQSIDSRSTVDRQKLLDPEELAVETERAGFRGAPEEAEMAEAPFCEHLSATPIPIQPWQREDGRWFQDLFCNLCAKFGEPNPTDKENRCQEFLGGGAC